MKDKQKLVKIEDEELTLRDIIIQLRSGSNRPIEIRLVTESLARISDRLDRLESK